MSDFAIKVENLSKLYHIGLKEQIHDTLGGALFSWLKKPVSNFKNLRNLNTSNHSKNVDGLIWALRDVSFEVKHGEVLGIIGRNGAGKSTLLKILSRITEPTKGRAVINGRVGSLLEVGTGFHPELTGRENVYMNGTILGMKKREIDAKFDEIIDFSGVEQFLDTPIKRYSSGMTVRLAFAVAAHLEPQIMIIDEVLAVGDVQFQKKCLGKIGQVANTGRTVIFVSHSMSAMEALTRSCLVLGEGRLTYAGPTQEAVQQYLKESQVQIASSNDVRNRPRPSYPMDQKIIFTELVFDHFIPTFDSNETIRILAKLYAKEQVSGFRFSGTVFQSSGAPVGSFFSPCQLSIEANEEAQFVVELADNHLAPGRYHFGLAVGAGNVSAGHRDSDILLEVLPFNINHPAGEAGTMGQWPSAWGAVIFQEPTVRRV